MTPQRGLLTAALALLAAALWIEPDGSWLAEPDEARYAEVPREMLASGDLVTPRLNGVPYLEKPPLFYWCNAASFALFGETPWAARLPARMAGAATVALLVGGLASIWGLEAGLAAGILYLASPLGFVLSRLNITDGLLAFFFAATLFAARRAIQRREEGRHWQIPSALAGLCAAGAVLTKGLIGLVLPGAVLLLWCLATRKTRHLRALLLAPAPLLFLAVASPWFLEVERRNPGFSQFFFVHEHFERFATPEAHRPGPPYYFLGIFVAGFLPGLPFFFSALRGKSFSHWMREEADLLFFLLWFFLVFLFFSFSSSKLPPYLLPAFPAAAALAARGAGRAGETPGRWRVAALLSAVLAAVVAVHPAARQAIRNYGLLSTALPALGVLVAGSWAAVRLARDSIAAALLAFSVGWFAFLAGAALAYPRVPTATDLHNIEIVARDAAANSGAQLVCYQAYLQGLPWELKRPVPVVDYIGELEPWFERRFRVRDALFWSKEKFWREWKSASKIIAVAPLRDLEEFRDSRVLSAGRKYAVVANFGAADAAH